MGPLKYSRSIVCHQPNCVWIILDICRWPLIILTEFQRAHCLNAFKQKQGIDEIMRWNFLGNINNYTILLLAQSGTGSLGLFRPISSWATDEISSQSHLLCGQPYFSGTVCFNNLTVMLLSTASITWPINFLALFSLQCWTTTHFNLRSSMPLLMTLLI